MASKQVGTEIGETGIQQTGDIWTLNNVARECMQTYLVPYPDILSVIDFAFPLGSVANNSYPLVKLVERQLTQRQHGSGNPDLAELKLKFEQTEPDEDESPPEDTLVEFANTQEVPITQHPEAQDANGLLFTFIDEQVDRIHIGDTADFIGIPEELRGLNSYLLGTREVVRTEYSATKFNSVTINVTEDPPGNYGESGKWRITSGSTGNSGRWYVRTRSYTFNQNGWPPDIYDTI